MSNSEILSILTERQELVRLVDECKARIEELTGAVKDFMGDDTELVLGAFKVTYKEVQKRVADTAAMKAAGIYDEYSKVQVTRPFTVR